MIMRILNHKLCNKVLYLLFIFVLLISVTYMNAKASNANDISINTTYGFDQITKVDSNTPFTISVTNKGEKIKVRVQVILSSVINTNSPIETVLLNGYKEKNYMFEKSAVIAANSTTDIIMTLPIMNETNQIKINIYDEYGSLIKTMNQTIEADDYSYYAYAGILSDDPTVLNYFQNTALYQYNDYNFQAILLEENEIPDEIYGLDLFDILITDQEKLDHLTEKQKQVINNWERNGGFLINLSTITNPDISWESLIPDNQMKQWDYIYRTYNWAITNALDNVHMNKIPNFMIYVVILSLYIILIGPLLYLILKKLNKRKFIWFFEIAGSLLFMTIIILLGQNTRLKAPFINYFKIESFNEKTIDSSVFFNIRAPYNNEYKLYLDKAYSIKPIYDIIYYDNSKKRPKLDDYNIGISQNDKENVITVKNDEAFTKECFCVEKSKEIDVNNFIHVSMNMFGNKVTGTVTNNMNNSIENAAILVYNKVIFLKTIPANTTIKLDNKAIFTYNPKFKYGLTNEIAGLKVDKKGFIKDGYVLQNQKKSILDYYVEEKFGVYNDKAYLIGFTSDRNHLELQLDSSYAAYGMTMIEVPINVNYTKKNLLYTTYVPIKNEEYSSSGDIMYTDEMILTYSLGKNLTDITLFFNKLSYYDGEYYKAFSGHIYFYNRNTTLYDPFDLSQKKVSAEALKPYLNENNEIVIKYVEHFDKEEKQALLPSLSTIGRVK